eukprot:CAMPEP_0184869540 /NCGR_PEP_ID=MMETSP0580-20130426/34488_1 /TAXON_ID=1118495 /ORGANISM="Dactyliosolen fragilissimus" /LENGTH=570 /DNA_ID=CAMNT_0027371087 /DNA_START=243 /DNA_END=1955 /DNA_ORIENTATION=-
MRLLKTTSANITLFLAASLVASWSVPKLVDGQQQAVTKNKENQESSNSSSSSKSSSTSSPCPAYGCALLPRDTYFDEEAQAALKVIRSLQVKHLNSLVVGGKDATPFQDRKKIPEHENVHDANDSSPTLSIDVSSDDKSSDTQDGHDQESNLIIALDKLKTSGGRDQATLTLIGYKGGKLEDQINQDRAFVISPYIATTDTGTFTTNVGENQNSNIHSTQDNTHNVNNTNSNNNSKHHHNRILGVFDGHAKLGELVSEFSVQQLPKVLSLKLAKILNNNPNKDIIDKDDSSSSTSSTTSTSSSSNSSTHIEGPNDAISSALIDTFVELDRTAPADKSGGCTASIVLQVGTQVYIANTGDSRSFIATYIPSTSTVEVIYVTKEHKPHLPEERARVEKMGGYVYIPPSTKQGASSRVVFIDKKGMTNGLAMSRSIGDWDAGELGVIPDPTIEVLDLRNVVNHAASAAASKGKESSDANEGGSRTCQPDTCQSQQELMNEIEVFAVAATDGMLDYMDIDEIAQQIATSLYNDEGPHLLSACESLINAAARKWNIAKNGRYRDDIAIAVSKLSL